MDTQQFALEIIEWLKSKYEKELTPDTREEIIDAIESITLQVIADDLFAKKQGA